MVVVVVVVVVWTGDTVGEAGNACEVEASGDGTLGGGTTSGIFWSTDVTSDSLYINADCRDNNAVTVLALLAIGLSGVVGGVTDIGSAKLTGDIGAEDVASRTLEPRYGPGIVFASADNKC